MQILQIKLKLYEQNWKCFENEYYLRYKLRLEEIYEITANGVKIRSKCDWYEYGEKSSKFFINLEKKSLSNSWIDNRGKRINRTKWNQ